LFAFLPIPCELLSPYGPETFLKLYPLTIWIVAAYLQQQEQGHRFVNFSEFQTIFACVEDSGQIHLTSGTRID